jgi:hypothetical protein
VGVWCRGRSEGPCSDGDRDRICAARWWRW